ncbi:MAG TPA: cytochrome b [Reyranellaceae bacterium]|nr:cytochrome b [Reyranellaceae bacterium]
MALTYHPVAKLLHWLTAIAVIGMVGVGWWMVGLPLGLLKLQVYGWHKWVGLTILAITLLRLLWRWRVPAPPLPDTVAPWERRLAPFVHGWLLGLLLAMPLTGWLMSSAAGVAVVWFGVVPMPDLVPRDPDLFEALRDAHNILSKLLVATVLLHWAAVVRHDVLRRDGIFRRMSPFSR